MQKSCASARYVCSASADQPSLRSPLWNLGLKIFYKKLAQSIGCIYICNQLVANIMRRDVFHAIADPTRRAILGLIALQAMTPNALAEHFETSRQSVSKHIHILTECNLVTKEQNGREIFYNLNSAKMKEIAEWLEPFRLIWEDRFNKLDDVLAILKTKV